jgi:AraC family transcriptional regulator
MTESQTSRLLVESPLVRVYDVVCRTPRSGYGPLMFNSVTQIGLPRRGVFVMERRGEPVVIDTNTALVLGPDDEYRVRHPSGGGDEGTVVVLPPHLVEQAIGGTGGRLGSLRPRDHLAICLVTRALRDRDPDQLEAEDATLLLVASLSRAFAGPTVKNRLGLAQRLRVERARALLASSPTTRWALGSLGRVLRCSPFHLARQFRTATGETISRYVLRLRLGIAVERLADGERDIASLAVDIGFTHHSHFSARFRSVFGITPTQARDMLATRNLEELRAGSTESRPSDRPASSRHGQASCRLATPQRRPRVIPQAHVLAAGPNGQDGSGGPRREPRRDVDDGEERRDAPRYAAVGRPDRYERSRSASERIRQASARSVTPDTIAKSAISQTRARAPAPGNSHR